MEAAERPPVVGPKVPDWTVVTPAAIREVARTLQLVFGQLAVISKY